MIGASGCSGVTHLAVSAANYFYGVHRKQTAMLEWNSNGDLARMERRCTGAQQEEKPYQVLGVDYFKDAGMKELLSCLDQEYQRIVVDFGVMSQGNCDEFLRCDRKIVIGALTEWQLDAFLELADHGQQTEKKGLTYACVFGSEEVRKQIKKKLNVKISRVPISVDAFTITGETMQFFDRLLKD